MTNDNPQRTMVVSGSSLAGRIARLATSARIAAATAPAIATQHYREVKAEIQGKARSKARKLMPARDIPVVAKNLKKGAPEPISGANVKTHDGTVLTFFTDGSLRKQGHRPPLSGRQLRIFRKRFRATRKAMKAASAKEA